MRAWFAPIIYFVLIIFFVVVVVLFFIYFIFLCEMRPSASVLPSHAARA